jgi:excisionase family DNA binding protein
VTVLITAPSIALRESCLPQDPLIDTLRTELEAVLAAARAARKALADYERSERVAEKARKRAAAASSDDATTLRVSGMTVAEAATVLGVSHDRVRAMLQKNVIRGVQFGSRVGWRLDRREVHEVAERLEAQRRGRTLARDAALRGRGPG